MNFIMKRLLFLIIVLFAFTSVFVSAENCHSFCVEKYYLYGACRSTSESKGFCSGKDETVYGFSECKDFQRCCCGNDPANAPSIEEEVAVKEDTDNNVEEVVASVETSSSAFSFGDFAERAFSPLFWLVVLLAVGVILKKKAFRKEEKKGSTEQ